MNMIITQISQIRNYPKLFFFNQGIILRRISHINRTNLYMTIGKLKIRLRKISHALTKKKRIVCFENL